MIGSSRRIRVFAYPAPADLRKGYDGLYGLVVNELHEDPLSGDCYLFTNRRRTSSKVLHFDGTGLCIYSKRLETGCFACLWANGPGQPVRLTMSELALFLEGSRLAGRIPLSPPALQMSASHLPPVARSCAAKARTEAQLSRSRARKSARSGGAPEALQAARHAARPRACSAK